MGGCLPGGRCPHRAEGSQPRVHRWQPESRCPQGRDGLTEFSLRKVGPETRTDAEMGERRGRYAEHRGSPLPPALALCLRSGLHSGKARLEGTTLLCCSLANRWQLPPAGSRAVPAVLPASPTPAPVPHRMLSQWSFFRESVRWSPLSSLLSVTPPSLAASLSAGSGLGWTRAVWCDCDLQRPRPGRSLVTRRSWLRACRGCSIVVCVAGSVHV